MCPAFKLIYVIDILCEKRQATERLISNHLMDPIDAMVIPAVPHHTPNSISGKSCQHNTPQVYDYLSLLKRVELWPILPHKWDLGKALHNLITFQSHLKEEDIEIGTAKTKCGGSCSAYWVKMRRFGPDLRAKIRESSTGLCLDCLRSGVEQGQGTSCRIKHI